MEYHLNRMPNTLINIGGIGEPTLHPQLTDIVSIAFRTNNQINLITNGTKFKENFLSKIPAPYLRSINQLVMSYQYAQLNDVQRREFVSAVRMACNYMGAPKISITIVADDEVIDNIDEILETFKEIPIAPSFQMLYVEMELNIVTILMIN